MDTLPEDRVLEVLDEATCLDLLRLVTIGRIAFTEGALPAVQPVAFVLGRGEVFVPTHPGSKVAAASRGAVVAFAVDDVDPRAGTGWTVTVVGRSRLIADPAEVSQLDRLGMQPWVPGGGHCYIGIAVQLVQGCRVSRPGLADAVLRPLDGATGTAVPR